MTAKTRIWGLSVSSMAVVVMAVFTIITLAPTAHAGPKGTNRPIEGSCDTFITPLTPPGVFPAIIAVDSACHLSHLGLTTGGTDFEVITPSGPPAGTELPVSISVPLIVYVAANGDQLFSTFVGTGSIDFATGIATFDGTETYLGGTGRFLHAMGQAHTAGAGSLFTNLGAFTTSGNVTY